MIYTGGAAAQVETAWNSGMSVIALCDAPPASGRTTIAARAGELSFKMPVGLMRLACARRMPVVWFCAAVDRDTGRRRIDIEPERIYADPQVLADALAARLGALIVRDSAAWHMWPYANHLVSVTSDARAGVET